MRESLVQIRCTSSPFERNEIATWLFLTAGTLTMKYRTVRRLTDVQSMPLSYCSPVHIHTPNIMHHRSYAMHATSYILMNHKREASQQSPASERR